MKNVGVVKFTWPCPQEDKYFKYMTFHHLSCCLEEGIKTFVIALAVSETNSFPLVSLIFHSKGISNWIFKAIKNPLHIIRPSLIYVMLVSHPEATARDSGFK